MRLKKWVKVTLFIIAIFIIVYAFYPRSNTIVNKNKDGDKVDEPVIDNSSLLYSKLKDKNISLEFIKWVEENYKGSSTKMVNLLKDNEYNDKLWHKVTGNSFIVLNDLYNKKYESMDNVKILKNNNRNTIDIVGDVSLADNWYIMPAYNERNKKVLGILSDEVVKEMNDSTLMVVNSEFTVSHRGSPMAGKQYTFRGKKENLSIYNEMGVDLVTLANNHVYDFGKDAFLDMLDAFDEYNIPRIGAGHNDSEAKKPYYFIINGYKFSFVNATRAEKYILTPEATSDSPGVFRCYDPTNMMNLIKEEKKNSDYVIAIIHYGTEGSHVLEQAQIDSSKMYIDSGADMVVGHHAHNLQGIEIYNDKPIIYNLGNFIFNSLTIDTAIFQVKVNDDGNMDYYILPALQKDCYTEFLKDTERQRVINDINSWSINAEINNEGKIVKK